MAIETQVEGEVNTRLDALEIKVGMITDHLNPGGDLYEYLKESKAYLVKLANAAGLVGDGEDAPPGGPPGLGG